jgi:secondary thiamine-phosphate synthase enzyme
VQARTNGRGTSNITTEVNQVVQQAGIDTGLCHCFIRHTSASIILCENAAPEVRDDLEYFMAARVPDGDPNYRHDDEGPDDMAAHIRTILTHSDLTIPVVNGRLGLGTWQGIYLWEHRTHPHHREIIVTVWE